MPERFTPEFESRIVTLRDRGIDNSGVISFDIQNEVEQSIGYFKIKQSSREKDEMVIYDVVLGDSYIDQGGYGIAVYKKLIQYCKDKNLKLVSGFPQEPAAEKIWLKLIDQGFAEELNDRIINKYRSI